MNCKPCLATALILALAAPVAQAEVAPAHITGTAHFTDLTIGAAALPQPPEGKQLTLSVDGVELPLQPGRYAGDVALSVTDDIPVQYLDLPVHHFRSALYVENGAPVWSKSIKAVLGRGTAEAGKASKLDIRSHGPNFNGVIVAGEGAYVLDRPVIDMVGNGGNDFAGYGAAIMATDKAELTLERPIIRTRGAIRTALFVGGEATVRVNNAEIETYDGTLPEGYRFTVDLGRMMEVPWMLGVSGNVRASNLVGNGTLIITNSHIRSQGWGGLSTDIPRKVRMVVKDSLIELIEAGYGTYSIGDSHNVFEHSIIRSPEVGGIIGAQGMLTFTDGTRVDAGTYGVMMHSGLGGGSLVIADGSELHAGRAAIEVKGVGTTIKVEDARVSSREGIILQAMENDDPVMAALMRGELPEGMTTFPPGLGPDAAAEKEKGPRPSPNVSASFRGTRLAGDIWNARFAHGGMILDFEDATIAGRISTSRASPVSGVAPDAKTYREVGHVANVAVPAGGKPDALVLHLGKGSQWTVTGTSYLTELSLDPQAKISAAKGRLVMRIDGKPKAITPGVYRGEIVLDLD
ncbi:hypothetical protein HT136_18990 [Novosphingobium profundi]|uniref:hypothetical protein n=1 Tax=Novosphingobium profundi TaxID=1774954 RepID=UPI001BD943FC|nr:hypothetical protein [Novosphingobium profundi]MBT0670457.1 hypothetical protein [Novosphingobium profundi]